MCLPHTVWEPRSPWASTSSSTTTSWAASSSSRVSPEDATVLEVGPGIGTLTLALCEAAGRVVAIERDTQLQPVLADTLAGRDNVSVLYEDAVRVTPAQVAAAYGPPQAFVANLPYGVAATLVLRFFEALPALEFAVVMVQAEVADRMVARPGSKDYGAYSVKLQLLAAPAGRFPGIARVLHAAAAR